MSFIDDFSYRVNNIICKTLAAPVRHCCQGQEDIGITASTFVRKPSSASCWSNFNAERVSDYKDDSPHELETKHHQHMIWDHLPGPQNVAKCHSASFLENS